MFMKKTTVFSTLIAATTASSDIILMDQIGLDNGASVIDTNIKPNQIFEDNFSIYDTAVIDNFTANQENLTTVEMVLAGWNGFVDPSNINGFSANLYSTPQSAELTLIGDIGHVSVDIANTTMSPTWLGVGFLFLMPASMEPNFGENWFSMIPENEFGTNGQVGVPISTLGDQQAYQANPGGGFGFTLQLISQSAPYRILGQSPCSTGFDCNKNMIDDCDDIANGTSLDCNSNSIPDECDISQGTSLDTNTDGIPDECQDCNMNGIPDPVDIKNGTSIDIDGDGFPDECQDCNMNGQPDFEDILNGVSNDCNQNDIPDECDLTDGYSFDCNNNSIPDECDVINGTSFDCDQNNVPDECQPDCDEDGFIDACDSEPDIDGDGIPDQCEIDCNENTIPDDYEIELGISQDCNGNLVPDECDIADGVEFDCNSNAIPDSCELIDPENDQNNNGILDNCECAGDADLDGYVNVNDLLIIIGYWGNDIPQGDLNGDGIVDVTDLLIVVGNWGQCE